VKNNVIIVCSLVFMVSGCIAPKNVETRIDQRNKEIIDIHLPSLTYLYKLHFMIYESKELTRNWTYVYKSDDAIDKIKLRKIHSIDYPELEMKLSELKKEWSLKEQLMFDATTNKIEELFDKEKSIMNKLNSYESYEDVMIVFQVDTEFERGEDSITTITEEILRKLNELIEIREEKLKELLGT
jgi:methyl-accepting chemotaxis protein